MVATQTLEVGADVDAEFLVTEACGVRSLTQRLGRLNRMGRHPHARAIYVHLPPPTSKRRQSKEPNEWPVYGEEPAIVLRRLEDASRAAGNEAVNLAPRSVAQILGPPGDDPGRAHPRCCAGCCGSGRRRRLRRMARLRWNPTYSGIAAPEYSVSLIWRVFVPEDDELLWPRAFDREAVDVPLAEAREAFGEDEKAAAPWRRRHYGRNSFP